MFVSCTPSDLVAVPKMDISGEEIGCHDIAERFEQGAVTYAKMFCRLMDDNDWSHPRFVKLAQTATGGVAWVHSLSLIHTPSPRDATLSRMPSSA